MKWNKGNIPKVAGYKIVVASEDSDGNLIWVETMWVERNEYFNEFYLTNGEETQIEPEQWKYVKWLPFDLLKQQLHNIRNLSN